MQRGSLHDVDLVLLAVACLIANAVTLVAVLVHLLLG
jgi:hypothetical protein